LLAIDQAMPDRGHLGIGGRGVGNHSRSLHRLRRCTVHGWRKRAWNRHVPSSSSQRNRRGGSGSHPSSANASGRRYAPTGL
jgi:hypothetical protein